MIKITKVKRRPDGTIRTAKIVTRTRADCERYSWVTSFVCTAPMSWASLFHALVARPERN